jgi:hypothetical protein
MTSKLTPATVSEWIPATDLARDSLTSDTALLDEIAAEVLDAVTGLPGTIPNQLQAEAIYPLFRGLLHSLRGELNVALTHRAVGMPTPEVRTFEQWNGKRIARDDLARHEDLFRKIAVRMISYVEAEARLGGDWDDAAAIDANAPMLREWQARDVFYYVGDMIILTGLIPSREAETAANAVKEIAAEKAAAEAAEKAARAVSPFKGRSALRDAEKTAAEIVSDYFLSKPLPAGNSAAAMSAAGLVAACISTARAVTAEIDAEIAELRATAAAPAVEPAETPEQKEARYQAWLARRDAEIAADPTWKARRQASSRILGAVWATHKDLPTE